MSSCVETAQKFIGCFKGNRLCPKENCCWNNKVKKVNAMSISYGN